MMRRAGNGTRTRDINLGKVALYQLSYSRDCFDLASFPHFGGILSELCFSLWQLKKYKNTLLPLQAVFQEGRFIIKSAYDPATVSALRKRNSSIKN